MGAGKFRSAAEESREGKDDHSPARQVIEDTLHPLILRRVEGPEPRCIPIAAATGGVAVEVVACDRERIVTLLLRPIEERGAFRVVPVLREEPVADMKPADERGVATAPAEPLGISGVYRNHSRQIGSDAFERALRGGRRASRGRGPGGVGPGGLIELGLV